MLQACKLSELCKQEKSARSWRAVLPIHPAAELLPRTSPDESRALGEDVIRNGLTSPVVLCQPDSKTPLYLLDGISRLDAIELVTGEEVVVGPLGITAGEFTSDKVIVLDKSVDPWAYVISANVHRRHLTAEQKREVIAALLKAQPKKSDRQIAETAKVSPTTVGTVRAALGSTVQVGQLPKRIGKDGKARKQPAKKAAEKTQEKKPEVSGLTSAVARGDIGVGSPGEIERLQARVEELENKNRQLEIKNKGLKSENEELKTEIVALRTKLEATATIKTVAAGDFGPFPECLLRKPKATSASDPGEGVPLRGVVVDLFSKLHDLAGDCRDQVDNAPEGIDQSPRIETLDTTAGILEELRAPDVPTELAELKVVLPKHCKPRTRSDRRYVAVNIIAATMTALMAIGEDDPRHQKSRALCGELQDVSEDIEECEF